jgi:hypothetical protein
VIQSLIQIHPKRSEQAEKYFIVQIARKKMLSNILAFNQAMAKLPD